MKNKKNGCASALFRECASALFRESCNLGKTGNNLVDEIGIGFIKKKVVDDASQFKGKIGFGL